MEYTKDIAGQEVLLKDGKFQVMMEWEKPYMEACIDALQPRGCVLEVGFGCGYSANRIQHYHPKSHTIIEYHPVVAAKAREWAKNFPHVTIVEGTWQDMLPTLGVFDALFFDDYPLQTESELQQLEQQSEQSSFLLQSGKNLVSEVHEKIPHLQSIRYTKQDLEFFLKQLESQQVNSTHLYRFLNELKEQEQITVEQYQELIQELLKRGLLQQEDLIETNTVVTRATQDRFFHFLKQCLAYHMRRGSRFSCFLSGPSFVHENVMFYNEIIANPDLDYTEKEIPIEVPKHCTYYTAPTALVITIEKMK